MTPTEFRERRQFLGYTQQGIAERLGLSRRSIQAYESGETTISRVIEMALSYRTRGKIKMKYTTYKDGSVKIKMTKAEVPFMSWVLDEGIAGANFQDDEEAKCNLSPDAFKSWKHMGRPSCMGSVERLTVEKK